jgi:hypothetical protein
MGKTSQAKQTKSKVSLWLTLGLCLLFSSLTTAHPPTAQTVLDTDTFLDLLTGDENVSDNDLPALAVSQPLLDAAPARVATAPGFLLMPYATSAGSSNSPRGPPLLF